MSKITLTAFLSNGAAIADEKPEYHLGHDGSDGKCDCIGFVIGAIRRSGGVWNGTHGSNYAARNEMEYLLPVTDPDDLNVGEVVYKVAMPGQSNYNLPSRYAEDPDQRDYYHVGIVRSVDPLLIVHCTGPGIVEDTTLGKWTHRGWLSKVSREEEIAVTVAVETATVVAESGSTVRMRSTPSAEDRLYWDVPLGTIVPVSGHQNGWSRVSYNGRVGWMMDRYLRNADAEQVGMSSHDMVSVILPRDLAERLRDALTEATGRG